MRFTGLPPVASALMTLLVVVQAIGTGTAVLDLTDTATFEALIGKGRPALVEYYAPWCGHCQQLEPVYEQLAEAFTHAEDRVIIARVNADSNKALGQRFGVTSFPTLKWFRADSQADAEDYLGGRDLEALSEYVKSRVGGGIKPKIKPAPPPAATQLDAHNFDDIALDPTKHVLVEFYAPWCGHCKRLAPIYDAVAKTYVNEDNCVVAQIDADDERNRALAKKYEVQSFPTIKFFPRAVSGDAASPDPQTYMGGREEKDFITFLNGKCGVHRTAGGGLNDLAGRLPSLDSFASRLYTARLRQAEGEPSAPEEVRRIAQDAKDFVSKVQGGVNATADKDRMAEYYLKIIDKLVVAGDVEYVDRESARLRKILDKNRDSLEATGQGTLAPRKEDDVKRRLNVLSAFMKRQLSDRVKASESNTREEEPSQGGVGGIQGKATGAGRSIHGDEL